MPNLRPLTPMTCPALPHTSPVPPHPFLFTAAQPKHSIVSFGGMDWDVFYDLSVAGKCQTKALGFTVLEEKKYSQASIKVRT